MECWAKGISPCQGGITGEHLVSKTLLGTSVGVRGLPWCKNEYKEVGASSLVANILCAKHNSELSHVDSEARRLKDAIPMLFRPEPLRGRDRRKLREKRRKLSKKERPAVDSFQRFDAWLFARWICKTYVDIKASVHDPFDTDFVSYSFASPTQKRLHFYCPARIGRRMDPALDQLVMRDLFTSTGDVLFYVNFYGLDWIATNLDLGTDGILHAPDLGLEHYPARELLDRLTAVYKSGGTRVDQRNVGRLFFDWSNEPFTDSVG